MHYIVKAAGAHNTYYLAQDGDRYVWRHGDPGREAAFLFDTESEAQAVIDSGHRGRGGATARVVPVID